MSKKAWLVCSIVFLVIVFLVISNNTNLLVSKKSSQILVDKPEDITTSSEIIQFAAKYNAATKWDREFGNSYSYSLQNKYIGSNNPLLFSGYVDDVYTSKGKYFIRLNSFSSYDNYILEAECSKKFADIISESDSKNWVVVANVKSISKPIFGIVSDNGNLDEDSYKAISVEQADKVYIIKAVCVDILKSNNRES